MEGKHCKWYNDEFCTNGDSPCVADYCPVVEYPELCKHREVDKDIFTDGDWKFSEQLTPITVTSKEPLAEEDYESAKILCMKHCEFLPECQEQAIKWTAEKFARLVEFHSVSTRDNDGREIFTISALGLKEILHEEFDIPYDEICKEITEGKV